MRRLCVCMGSRSGRFDRPFRLASGASVSIPDGAALPAPRQRVPGRPSCPDTNYSAGRIRSRKEGLAPQSTGDEKDDDQSAPERDRQGPGPPSVAGRKLPFPLDVPFIILAFIGRAGFYCTWYLAFYVLCMFRPFTGLMVVAAIVMVPISIVVYAHPEAAHAMPFWTFGLLAIGLVALALAYTLFVDWLTPPGVTDPFERYRKHH